MPLSSVELLASKLQRHLEQLAEKLAVGGASVPGDGSGAGSVGGAATMDPT